MAATGLRGHLSGSVPISIAAHLVVLLLLFIIPLAATVILPSPAVDPPEYVRLAPLPPPPAVVLRTSPAVGAATAESSAAAPTQAPEHIAPEPVDPSAFLRPDAVEGGAPAGIGEAAPVVLSAPSPPPAPKPAGPLRAAQLPVPPEKIVDVKPVYPDLARVARREGVVVMEAVLDTGGRVTQLRVIKSEPLLDQAALDAVRQWRYTPTVYGGHPVSVLMTITVRFSLR